MGFFKKAKTFFSSPNEQQNDQEQADKTIKEEESGKSEHSNKIKDDGADHSENHQSNGLLHPSASNGQIHQSTSNTDIAGSAVSSTPATKQSHLNNNDISIATTNDSSLTTPVPSSENLQSLQTSEKKSSEQQASNTLSTPNNTLPSSPSQTNISESNNNNNTTTTTNNNNSNSSNNTTTTTTTTTTTPATTNNTSPTKQNSISSTQPSQSSTSLLVSTLSKFKLKLGGGKSKDHPSSAPSTPHQRPHRSTLVIPPGSVPTNQSGQKSTTPEHPPEEHKPVEKEVITIATITDFPDDCQKLIRISGIPEEKLIKNIQILAYVLHFRTGRFFKLVDEPPREPRKKFVSERFNDGESLVEHVEPQVLKKMYKDSDQVGKGGFGTVYFAKSTKEKRLVAIKKMPHITKRQQQQNYREAAILAKCDHPNIVKLHTCHIDKDSNLWIIMEFMEGGTFEEAAKAWKFNENNLAYVAKELLKGLQYLHENGMVHRDLKSANIMMSVEGKVKLIDFGLCEDVQTSSPTHMVGSPFWMAPEMIQQKPHSTPVDIWSFAISLLEMANQRPPMMESAVKAMFTVATEGATGFDDPGIWSDCFKDFLSLCLKMDPAERATAADLLKHPFIKKADSRDNMENILKKIFLTNSLMNSGF
ncbi:hypothetical protein DICPUDRAFT_158544 [Dictyostelium purpureum]|uniref:non-specific serine/threonine protein kinase n=1 Tax=Dictyostelium purpureum TaxID=5786 RepID=F1A1V5_DICPU|nr:uncharacterized protein DICPUDRAFT_158544 [Dictyostelium purpureum]EGC29829.1 hypothetical protein DICPUDRAFT_158544 [Dictyostelium purpureum]|eukprot:XP_003293650.1 hypothetical protein DICPUDRAFT_158544 [Dictyostelium purpureum]